MVGPDCLSPMHLVARTEREKTESTDSVQVAVGAAKVDHPIHHDR